MTREACLTRAGKSGLEEWKEGSVGRDAGV